MDFKTAIKSISIICALAGLAGAADYTAWSGHRSITLNTSPTGANVTGTVTNFPVLVRLGSQESAILSAANGGNSIRFSKADDATPLPYQIESWSGTAAAIWVKVDTVKGNNATQAIRMHWGNAAAASESDGAAVFDTARGYRAVFHMEQASGNVTDATVNALVGTNTGTTTTAGNIGPARNFAGTNAVNTSSTTDRQFIDLGAPAALNFNGPATFSAWIRWVNVVGTGGNSVYRTIINRDGSGGSPNQSAETFLRIGQNAGTQLSQSQYATGKYTGSADIMAMSPQVASSYPDSAVWIHLAGVYDSTGPTSRLWRLYRNGVQIAASTDNASAGIAGAATLWRIGRGTGTQNARWFSGDIDEVRIDAATRDSNYIKLSYENQKAANSLVDIGLPLGKPYAVWTNSRSIVLNTSATGANVSGDVTGFPVLVRLGPAEASIISAANNGNSIRFTKADSMTALPYQIESWSSTAAAIWVKVDTVKGNNATQSIRMFWGNAAAASESNGAAVFDTANGFRGVWHLGPDSVGVSKDATGNRNHATQRGAATATQGVIGGARAFNASGAGDIDTVGINQTFNMSVNDRVTVSAWVRRNGSNAAGSAFEGIAGVFDWNRNGTGVNNRMYSLVHNANNGFSFHVSSNGGDGANEVIVNSGIFADANWTHAAATVDGANIRVYVNGVSAVQSAYTGNIHFPATLTGVGPFTIGMLDDNGSGEGQYFNGGIDEVRLSGIARSADWMKLEFESQKVANSLTDIGQPAVPGAPTAVTGVAGVANSGSITVSWTAPASNGGASVTSYKAMVATAADSAKSCTTAGTLSCTITGLTGGASYTFVVRAYNVMGGGALSAASAPVNAPVSLLGANGVMLNVGSFTKAYTFRLSDRLAGTTERLLMTITDVSGKTVWSRSVSPSEAGREVSWNGMTANGARAGAGIYFVRVFTVTAAGKLEAVQGGVKLDR